MSIENPYNRQNILINQLFNIKSLKCCTKIFSYVSLSSFMSLSLPNPFSTLYQFNSRHLAENKSLSFDVVIVQMI